MRLSVLVQILGIEEQIFQRLEGGSYALLDKPGLLRLAEANGTYHVPEISELGIYSGKKHTDARGIAFLPWHDTARTVIT